MVLLRFIFNVLSLGALVAWVLDIGSDTIKKVTRGLTFLFIGLAGKQSFLNFGTIINTKAVKINSYVHRSVCVCPPPKKPLVGLDLMITGSRV